MALAYLGLGSNISAERMLEQAFSLLESTFSAFARSAVHRSAPWGGVSQADFLNAAVRVETGLSPHALLHTVKRMEKALGRVPSPRWGPRCMDIDILLYEDWSLGEKENGKAQEAQEAQEDQVQGQGDGRERPEALAERVREASGERLSRAWCSWEVQSADLVIPHPRLLQRVFALKPLTEFSPEPRIPPTGRGAGFFLAALERELAEGQDGATRSRR